MVRILVVEDDPRLRKVYATVLQKSGYEVMAAEDAQQALDMLEQKTVDLMVCDIMMPGMDGYELTRELKVAGYEFPVLMATARDSFPDKQEGFNAGADDYMVKPIDLNEMLLRVQALLRRAKIANDQKIVVGDTELRQDSLELVQAGAAQTLPQKEFFLLFKLLSNPGKVFTRQQLMDDIWGLDTQSDLRTVDVHINKLRERLKASRDIEMATVRGLGYKAVKKQE